MNRLAFAVRGGTIHVEVNVMAANLVTSVQYLYPNQVNGSVPTSQQSLPPRTPAVRSQPQQAPLPPQTMRIPVQQPSPTPRVNLQAGYRMDARL